MICPHCNKIIAEGSTGCPFCKAQFFAPPQETVQAGAEVQRTLSGFLRFLVVLWKHVLFIFCIIAAILQALAGLKQIFSIAQSDISWQVLKPAFYYCFLTVFYLFLGIIYRKLAVKIEKKDIGFLHFWQISFVALVVASTLASILFNTGFLVIISFVMNMILFFLWNLYFAQSGHLRLYMGSSEYLEKSVLHKIPLFFTPNQKRKIVLLATVLGVVYAVLGSVLIYSSVQNAFIPKPAQSVSDNQGIEVTVYMESDLLFFEKVMSKKECAAELDAHFGNNAYSSIEAKDNEAYIHFTAQERNACKNLCAQKIYTLAKQLKRENKGIWVVLNNDYSRIELTCFGTNERLTNNSIVKEIAFYYFFLHALDGDDLMGYVSCEKHNANSNAVMLARIDDAAILNRNYT